MATCARFEELLDQHCGGCNPSTRQAIKSGLFCFGIVAAGVLFLVLDLGFGHIGHVQVTVEDAALTRFALLTWPATALAYNLSLTVAVRNPNWLMSVWYVEPLDAAYLFDGQRFDRVEVFEGGHKQAPRATEVRRLSTSSEGAYVALGHAGEEAYWRANATGLFEVEVALSGKVRYQAHITKCQLAVSCPLKLLLAPPGAADVVFRRVACKVAKPVDKNC